MRGKTHAGEGDASSSPLTHLAGPISDFTSRSLKHHSGVLGFICSDGRSAGIWIDSNKQLGCNYCCEQLHWRREVGLACKTSTRKGLKERPNLKVTRWGTGKRRGREDGPRQRRKEGTFPDGPVGRAIPQKPVTYMKSHMWIVDTRQWLPNQNNC